MTKRKLALLSLPFLLVASLFLYFQFSNSSQENGEDVENQPELLEEKPVAQMRFGLPIDSFEVLESVVKSGESFGNIMLTNGVAYPVIHKIANEFKDVFDVSRIRSGKKYALFCDKKDSTKCARYFVYENSLTDFFVFDLQENAKVDHHQKEVTKVVREVAGEINGSLYQTLLEKGASPELTMKMADVYAWTIDFFRIKKGDNFKVIFEEKFIDDTVFVGIGRILAADFNHGGEDFYSFYFEKEEENYSEYFDEKGESLRKAFLKAPLKFSRISSRYNPRRFHPVLKRTRPHLGTDYAAAHGTPIMSTADGEVIAAGYTRGNGNYVKVRHNSTYTTQYLHMSKFASGIRKGKIVKQGQTIGYVGSTGLATGPHVCYRFWKHGKQVDPYAQKLPSADPIKEEFRSEFETQMATLKDRLDSIEIEKEKEVILASLGN